MAIAFVKEVGTVEVSDSLDSITLTIPAAGVAAGNLLSITVISELDTQTVLSVADTPGNTYTVGVTQQVAAGDTFRITEIFAIATTALVQFDTISVTLSTATFSAKKLKVLEFSGTDSVPNDGATSAKDDAFPRTVVFTNLDSGSITPTDAAGIAVGHVGIEFGLIDEVLSASANSAPPGWVGTMRGTFLIGGLTGLHSQSATWTSTGATSSGPFANISDHYFGSTIRAFKAAGGPPPPPGFTTRTGGVQVAGP
jgi:hypothetical protein